MSERIAVSDHLEADLVVAGGGPVGVMTALLAAQRDLSVVVVESSLDVVNTARAIGLDDEIQRIFQNAGLLDELQAITEPAKGAEFVDMDGVRIIGRDVPAGTVTALGHPPTSFFYQPQLEALLRSAAVDAGVELVLGHTVSGFDDVGDGVVVDVEGPEPTTLRGRWLVGADGASSGIRKTLGVPFEDLGFDQDWLVVDTRLRRDCDLPQCVQQICDPARPVTFVPGFDRNRRWEFQLQPGETRVGMEHPDRVWELLRPWMEPDDATIERAVVYRFHATVAATMRAGNVLLAGDAAHQMPPFLGQGLCSGFRDAANVAWRLSMIHRGVASDRLLDAYDTERRPHARALAEHAVDTGRLIDQLAGRVDAGLDNTSAYGGARRFPHLEGGQLSGDHPWVGRQLPQPTTNGRRFDDRLGAGWSLIAHDATGLDDIVADWRPYSLSDGVAGLVVVPPDDIVVDVLEMIGARFAIVRPDRAIGAVADDVDSLRDHGRRLTDWFLDAGSSVIR